MKKYLLVFAVLLLMVPVAMAQDAPSSISFALNDLSARVGRTVTVNDLDSWTFEQQVFPDTSLGCPQPDQFYTQVNTVGVRYALTYQGVTYDYRVTGDGSVVILCNESEVVPPCPPPDVEGYMPPRLIIGQQAQVEAGGFPNNVRELPGSSSRFLGEIPPGGIFTVLDGPNCTTLDKVVWWQVSYNGLIGWTAESQNGEYYLAPLGLEASPQPTATATLDAAVLPEAEAISAANVQQVREIQGASLEGAPEGEDESILFVLSPDGHQIVRGLPNGTLVPYHVEAALAGEAVQGHEGAVTALVAGTDEANERMLVASGGEDQRVCVWELSGTPNFTVLTITPVACTEALGAAITSLAISLDGSLIAAGDVAGNIYLLDSAQATTLQTFEAHDDAVRELFFSQNGSRLLSVTQSNEARTWGIPVAIG